VRNMFMVAMGLALIGYVVYPTAPPRVFPELGFTDSVAAYTHVSDTSSVNTLFNPYAAVPSVHVCFALMLGLSMARMVRRGPLRVLWLLYPGVMTFVVVVTANHWIFDAATGALTAALSTVAALLFARVRPQAWAWTPEPELAAPARAG
jgi:ABC-type sugar transport system permease subunit